jgi:hypothetical protein
MVVEHPFHTMDSARARGRCEAGVTRAMAGMETRAICTMADAGRMARGVGEAVLVDDLLLLQIIFQVARLASFRSGSR